MDLGGIQFETPFHLPLGLWLHLCPPLWLEIEGLQKRTHLKGPQHQPRLPDLLDRVIWQCAIDDTSQALEYAQRALAEIENTRLKGQVPGEIAGPGYSHSLKVALQGSRKARGVVA